MVASRRLLHVGGPLLVATALAGCGITKPAPGLNDGGGDAAQTETGGAASAPDLRFKWVNAAFTLKVHSHTNLGTALGTQVSFSGRVAVTPLELSGQASSFYTLFSTQEVLEPMHVIPLSGLLPRISAALGATVDERSIVVSLDSSLQKGFPNNSGEGLFNSVISGSEGGVRYQPMVRGAVSVGELAAWVAAHANEGHVVTALCPTATGLFVTAHGREGDNTAYETQVVALPLEQLVPRLEELGANGYVITALGRDGTGLGGAGNFIAVGTRAPGQTDARTIKTVDKPCVTGGGGPITPAADLFDEGYRVVGYVFHGGDSCDGTATWLTIAQR